MLVTVQQHKKALLVTGDTREIKDGLKGLGGTAFDAFGLRQFACRRCAQAVACPGGWNKVLVGWCFPMAKKPQVLQFLGSKNCTVTDSTSTSSQVLTRQVAAATTEDEVPATGAVDEAGVQRTEMALNDEGFPFFNLGSGLKRVTVSKWEGQTMVHIRSFYLKDGKSLPGKGIALSVEQWQSIKANLGAIDAAIAEVETRAIPKTTVEPRKKKRRLSEDNDDDDDDDDDDEAED